MIGELVGRRMRTFGFVLGLALVGAACVPVAPAPPPPPPPPTVVLYGDSLSVEAGATFASGMNGSGLTATEHVFGGVALCDWVPQMRSDLAALRAEAVVLQLTGNAITGCMVGVGDIAAKYATDLDLAFDRITELVDAADVFVVAAPPSQISDGLAFNAALEAVTTTRGGTWVPEPRGAVTTAGIFAWELPCLPDETAARGCRADGKIVVRSPDSNHFCPVKEPFACPPVYSSGARRFGETMAGTVRTTLGI